MLAIDPCARCNGSAVLESGTQGINNGRHFVTMHIRCRCRVRYSAHELASVTFEAGEKAAREAADQWNASQAAERAAR
jgi:hypothetical protein